MKAIRLAHKILRTLVRDRMYYPGRLLIDTFSIVARCGVLLVLYWYVFRLNNGIINNTTFIVAAWSMFFYFAFSVFRLRDISRAIMQDVQSGNIEVLFSKPISYLSYRMWWQVGEGLYPFLVISFFGAIILASIVGIPATMSTYVFIPTLVLVFLFGAILSLALYATVGLLAFWIEDVSPLFWIVDKAVMILGGSYLPVALFPNFMYKIALYSPFGASQFITHTVYGAWAIEWPVKIGIQIFWTFVFVIVVSILFAKARKKVSVNGG
ncbi:MAG: ABC-2 family transporter protein [Candidatus Azambacteria bacterium]|nr:ABC-2 family transporter protein [Candidatus Azambacteria bacterium]